MGITIAEFPQRCAASQLGTSSHRLNLSLASVSDLKETKATCQIYSTTFPISSTRVFDILELLVVRGAYALFKRHV